MMLANELKIAVDLRHLRTRRTNISHRGNHDPSQQDTANTL